MSCRTLVLGDSHVTIMKMGHDRLVTSGERVALPDVTFMSLGIGPRLMERFFESGPEGIEILTPGFRRKFGPRLPDLSEVAVAFCSNFAVGQTVGPLLRSGQAPGASSGVLYPISNAVFREIVHERLRFIFEFLDELVQRAASVFVVEGPRLFPANPILAEFDRSLVVEVRNAHERVVRDWLASRSIPVVAMPAACADEDSIMLPAYGPRHDRDFVHGNEAFGQVMTLEMARHLAAQSNGA